MTKITPSFLSKGQAATCVINCKGIKDFSPSLKYITSIPTIYRNNFNLTLG